MIFRSVFYSNSVGRRLESRYGMSVVLRFELRES
jgi:hypothetical protein